MLLYYAPCTISVAVYIALEESGLPYETRKVDFASAEQTTDTYAEVNPKGRVPALVHNDTILTETGALLEYIADLASDTGLRPADPTGAVRMREVMFYLASTMHVNHAHKMRGARWADQESSHKDMQGKVAETMCASCAYISDNVLHGPYLLGDQMCLADIYLYVICTWLVGDGVNLEDFPKIAAFMATMESRPVVRKIREQGLLQ